MTTIFSIEDEEALVSLLEYNITSAGYKFEHSSNGYEGMIKIQKTNPDLILLDWMLPDISGTEICKFIRSNKNLKKTPIIMLTAKGEENDLLAGFEMGCDDYITKPFSPAELIARIKALLKRSNEISKDTILSYSNIKMDTGTHRVYCCDEEAKLGPREYRILEFLMGLQVQLRKGMQLVNVNLNEKTFRNITSRLRVKSYASVVEHEKTFSGYKFKFIND